MIVSRSVFIHAPIDAVFSLVTDPQRRARLNPAAAPLAVDVEDGRPLHKGSRCHYRLQVGRRIVDYRTRVADLEPNRRLVAVAETGTPVRIEVRTAPEGDGTRLAQSETFEPTESMLEGALPETRSGFGAFVARVLQPIDGDEAFEHRKRQEAALEHTLGDNLERWLDAIKVDIESSRSG